LVRSRSTAEGLRYIPAHGHDRAVIGAVVVYLRTPAQLLPPFSLFLLTSPLRGALSSPLPPLPFKKNSFVRDRSPTGLPSIPVAVRGVQRLLPAPLTSVCPYFPPPPFNAASPPLAAFIFYLPEFRSPLQAICALR